MSAGERRSDPQGKRALFEAPLAVDRRQILAPGATPDGKDALFSSGPARPGTAVVECSHCHARTRVSLVDLGVRLVSLSVWLPARRHAHWLLCPACDRRSWCRVGWTE